MKKIIEWFQGATDPSFAVGVKAKLLANLDQQWADKEVKTYEEAVHAGFLWSSSPEGWDYWDKVTGGKYNPGDGPFDFTGTPKTVEIAPVVSETTVVESQAPVVVETAVVETLAAV